MSPAPSIGRWPGLATIPLVATTVLYLVYERATRRLGGALSMGQG
jgi:hypothetical protein